MNGKDEENERIRETKKEIEEKEKKSRSELQHGGEYEEWGRGKRRK